MIHPARLVSWRCHGVALVVTLASARAALAAPTAPTPPRIPLAEFGLLLPISVREDAEATAVGATQEGGTNVAGLMRAEVSIIGLIVDWKLDFSALRVGEYLGVDFGISQQGNIAGRILFGGQVSYELSPALGLGLRGYWVNTFEDLLPGAFGSHFHASRVLEATARVGGVIGRARLGDDARAEADAELNTVGVSLRLPTAWTIVDYRGWMIGVDYDRFTSSGVTADGAGSYTIHRLSALLMLGL